MSQKDKYSTVRMKESTKNLLLNLEFAKKNMSYEDIIIELLERFRKRGK